MESNVRYPDQTYGISSLMTAYHTDSQSGCIPYIYGGSGENHFDVDMGDTDSVYPCPTACWDGYTQYSMSDDLVGDEPVMTVERNIGFMGLSLRSPCFLFEIWDYNFNT